MDFGTIITLLLPVVFFLVHIYRKDKYMKEPAIYLAKAFFLGVMAYPCYFFVMGIFFIILPEESDWALQPFVNILCISSLPIELTKLGFLWYLLHKNDFFNEHVDSIVYAVFLAMGFAAIQSIVYIAMDEGEFTLLTIQGTLSAPANWLFGIIMGYYYSLAHFSKRHKAKYATFALLFPVLAHFAFDLWTTLMIGTNEMYEGIVLGISLIACYFIWIFANKRINMLLEKDELYFEDEE